MSRLLRLVLDTNVVVSALLWSGRPGQLFDRAGDDEIALFGSDRLIAELADSLAKPRLARQLAATGLVVDEHVSNYRSLVSVVEAVPLSVPVSRDPDDDRVLACAVAASADVIVSGDNDLLVLGACKGIAILRVGETLALLDELSAQRN